VNQNKDTGNIVLHFRLFSNMNDRTHPL